MGCCVSAPESARRDGDLHNGNSNPPPVLHRPNNSKYSYIFKG